MNRDNDMKPEDSNNNQQMGEDHMAVNNQELEMMKKALQKKNKDRLRKALLQKSVKENSELLHRLSKT